MIKFDCKGFCGSSTKYWHGYINKLVYCGNLLEISIILVQPTAAVICKTTSGFFVFFPHYECGSILCSLFDINENFGRLAAIFDEKDAFTIAFAINKVGHLLSKPRRRNTIINNNAFDNDLPF